LPLRDWVSAGTNGALVKAEEIPVAAILFVALALAALYWFPMRRWFGRWGTSATDRTRVMAGDGAVVDPTYSATLAITVDARPEHIWPWLVQMGYRRGGLYSYDWLDRLFGYLDRPSADAILPQFQQLAVGDEIPIGRGQGFPVTAIEPYRALVLSGAGEGFAWVWQFGLYPVDQTRTRLVSRNRVRPTDRGVLDVHACDRACGVSHDAPHAARSEAPSRSAGCGARWTFLACGVTKRFYAERHRDS